MYIDFHTHVLFGIDDGAKDADMSLAMLRLMKKQGTGAVAATPHYYAHRQSVSDFIHQRQKALDVLSEKNTGDLPRIIEGAEVYLEQGLRDQDLRPLCLGNTSYILVELPYSVLKSWMLEEVYNFCLKQDLMPIFAHLDRYFTHYTRENLQEIIDFDDAIIQINNEALYNHKSLKTVLGWQKNGVPLLIGSDCHNLSSRPPDNDNVQAVLKSKFGKSWLEEYNLNAENIFCR